MPAGGVKSLSNSLVTVYNYHTISTTKKVVTKYCPSKHSETPINKTSKRCSEPKYLSALLIPRMKLESLNPESNPEPRDVAQC